MILSGIIQLAGLNQKMEFIFHLFQTCPMRSYIHVLKQFHLFLSNTLEITK